MSERCDSVVTLKTGSSLVETTVFPFVSQLTVDRGISGPFEAS